MPTVERTATTAWRVLIADDDASIRSLLKDMLSDEGYEIVEVKSGAEVLRTVPKVEPNLVILDFKMPDMDGLDVLRRLSSQGHKVPVLMITGVGSASTAIKATQLGAFDYVTKPFEHRGRPAPRAAGVQLPVPRLGGPQAARRAWPRPVRADDRQQPEDAGHLQDDRDDLPDRRERPDHGRDRRRQGGGGRHDPPPLQLPERPAGQGEPDGAARRRWSRASCSGTRRARSPARSPSARAASRWPTRAPSSWTRSAT